MKHMFLASALSLLAFCASALAQERQADVPAGPATIHVTMRGTGEPIVLTPSYGRGADDFDDLSKRLAAAGFMALVPDPRGLGRSVGPMATLSLHGEGDDIAAVIRTLAPGGRAVVLGHARMRVRMPGPMIAAFVGVGAVLLGLRLANPVQRVDGLNSPVTAVARLPAELRSRQPSATPAV